MKKLIIASLILGCTGIWLYISSCTDKKTTTGHEELISYNFQIRPIFSDKCYKCHGPDANKRQAGLRLDIAEEVYKALKEHPRAHAIVPGNPGLSELFVRVSSTDTSIQMPPPESYLPALTAPEIAIVKKWIEQGAKYEPHWAFVAPKKSPLPKVNDAKWCKN
jgi:hypothetical protein